jgi:DNA modification methylase
MISATKKAHIRPVHPFPARMAPSIVWDALPSQGDSLKVLDPMSGSGTTLVCARMRGHHAFGCDTDPLALLIARAWCADVDPAQILQRAEIVLERATKFSDSLSLENSYPKDADEETRKFIDFWFDPETRCELTALSTCISRVRSESERMFLWCAFSRMIITKNAGVSLARDVSHSRPHRAYTVAPVKPFNIFQEAVATVVSNCPFAMEAKIAPSANIQHGDARSLPIENESIDIILTSPPYLNAIDYLRGHKLSLVWMGHDIPEIRAIRSDNIGAEVSIEHSSDVVIQEAMSSMANLDEIGKRHLGMIRRYVSDMKQVMKECSRVLKVNGKAIFVVGDSTIRGVFIKNSDAMTSLAKHYGLTLVSYTTRPIETRRRYLPPPESIKAGDRMQNRMREEVILHFSKTGT